MSKGLFRVMQPPAAPAHLAALRAACGALPASYLRFLAESDGAEACANDRGGDCLSLWPAREIPGLNEAYQIARHVPELLAIGSDGGGCAVGFDRGGETDPESWPVVRIGFGNLDRADFVRLASCFRDWREAGFQL